MFKNLIRFYFFFALIAMLTGTTFARNKLPRFETARMKSTAGTGVASILMDEATYLNPATIAYYKNSSFLFQKSGLETTTTNATSNPTEEFNSMSIIASDAKGLAGGSLSYNTIEYKGESSKRFSSAFGRPIGKKSSFGINLTYTKEKTFDENNQIVEQDYKQTSFGVAHAINQEFTLGLVLEDPFQERPEDTRAIAGFQYVFKGFVSLMFDLGADYNQNLSDTVKWSAASQLKVFEDFFLRFGTFNDKGRQEKGSGAGVGWLQPKLVLELAVKNTERLESLVLNQTGEDIKETSFSLSYRF